MDRVHLFGESPLPRSAYRWTRCGQLLDQGRQAAEGTDRTDEVTCERCLARLARLEGRRQDPVPARRS